MNLDFTPEENAFRDEVRTFIRDNYPAELRKAQGISSRFLGAQHAQTRRLQAAQN